LSAVQGGADLLAKKVDVADLRSVVGVDRTFGAALETDAISQHRKFVMSAEEAVYRMVAPSHSRWPRLPDGCRGDAVPLEAESKYDFRELGAYLGNVSLEREVFQHGGPLVGRFHHAWNVS